MPPAVTHLVLDPLGLLSGRDQRVLEIGRFKERLGSAAGARSVAIGQSQR
jgi:hypothetical protein